MSQNPNAYAVQQPYVPKTVCPYATTSTSSSTHIIRLELNVDEVD